MTSTAQDVVQRISDSYVGWQEDSFPGLLGNVVVASIVDGQHLGGSNCGVDAACACPAPAPLRLAFARTVGAGRSDMA